MVNTLDKLKAIIQENINQDATNVKVFTDVANILTKFQGKKPSKLIANALVKAHPDYTVNWRTEYGMYHIEVWGQVINRNYDNRISLLIAYDSNPVVDMDGYAKHSIAYGKAAEERNQLRNELLQDNDKLMQIANAIDNLNACIDTYIKMVDYPNPDMYYFDKLINGNSRLNGKR